jgi:hypothetical protein
LQKKRTIIVIASDTHAGHKLGLCNPETILEDNTNGAITKYNPDLSETQKFMWDTYEWGVEETIKLAGKDDIILIHNGDPTHGKASFLETMSSRLSDQLLIGEANINRWLQYKNVKMVRFAVGTGIHELGEGTAGILIANALSNKYPKLDMSVVYHGLLDVNGFVIDYAHHGPSMGGRKWLEGNELRYYLRSIMIGEILNGDKPPDLVIRGHYHTYRREFLEVNGNASWIILLPGFTFKDDYTRKATRSESKQSIGIIACEIMDGVLVNTHRFIRTIDIRTREVYSG